MPDIGPFGGWRTREPTTGRDLAKWWRDIDSSFWNCKAGWPAMVPVLLIEGFRRHSIQLGVQFGSCHDFINSLGLDCVDPMKPKHMRMDDRKARLKVGIGQSKTNPFSHPAKHGLATTLLHVYYAGRGTQRRMKSGKDL